RLIVNETQVIDEHTVKFVLNHPFVPFLQLLTHHSTSILSPISTPFDEVLNFLIDDIVGTGPFIYNINDNIWNVEIRLTPNPNYWRGKPNLDFLIIRYYDDVDDLWDAFIAQEVTILDPMGTSSNFYLEFPNKSLEMLKNDPKFTVQESQGFNFRYIGMNNMNINVTMRKAISYAINYSIMTEEKWPLISMRARSPIPPGIQYSNTTAFEVPYFNLSIARQTLLDANWSGTTELTANDNVSAGNEWETLVSNNGPLETYNISYWAASKILPVIALIVKDNLKQIGIKVNLIGGDERYWANHLFLFGWIYDYNDPHNAFYSLYSSKSDDNMVYGTHLNDSLVDQWIEEGVQDTNPISRKKTYYKLQKRIIEELYASVWTFSLNTINIYDSRLRGWQPNPHFKNILNTVYFV
ncbi:MAG: ABC transporter substrate-binding protein, partial [Promethearchaeota archaeon]